MKLALIGLTLMFSVTAISADAPIPQDKVRMEKRYRERLEWNRQTFQGTYDKGGSRNERWDGLAREALDTAARMYSAQPEPVLTSSDVFPKAKKALDAGCDDPMILYLYAISSLGPNYPGDVEYIKRVDAAAKAMTASRYPPFRRADALLASTIEKGMKKNMTSEDRLEIERDLDAIIDLFQKSVAEDTKNEHWEAGWFKTIVSSIHILRKLTKDLKVAFDKVDAKLSKIAEIKSLELTIKGDILLAWGSEARTEAFAFAVPPEQLQANEKRLTEARLAFEEAWKLNPGVAKVAESMMAIEKSIGHGDRQAMETWFERAMTADGNYVDACWQKLDWLDPKWHGTSEEMLAFGRQCRDTKNWRARITLLIGDAHLRVFEKLPMKEKQTYFVSPEVWSDINPVFEEYLKHVPFDHVARSQYAVYCFYSRHYNEANTQFKILGDHLTQWKHYPYVPLQTMKMMRTGVARAVGENGVK